MSASSSDDASAARVSRLPAIVVLGEILWDVFPGSRRLGGAPLNFAAHARSFGHRVTLISSLGNDAPGREARTRIAALGLDTAYVQTCSQFDTGTATVGTNAHGDPVFAIARPAAYDAIDLSPQELEQLRDAGAGWLYFGSLLAAASPGRRTLEKLLAALSGAHRFLDLNLRTGADTPELARALLKSADVVKLNENELIQVSRMTGLPREARAFCRAGSEHFGWHAVCVTLGARGCAMRMGEQYVESPGVPVVVADTVGAGDAFAAAFMHGLSRHWSVERVAAFSNAAGASVARVHGSLPDP